MDVFLSAVASDLVGRLVSFLVGKCQVVPGATDTAVRLQRALVRARVVVEEAEGRQIANRAMLEQLNQLRRELFRAAYALDAFRWRTTPIDPSSSRRRSRAMASRSPSHTRPGARGSDCPAFLSEMVESLEAALSDMREFVVFLGGCPRVTKQPYSVYLFLENCMFGRQMEKEEIIGFLLKPCQDLDVLPIIGPHGVGKRTLVEQVCLDERVRERFTEIHRLRSDDLQIHEHHRSRLDVTARSLTVIDIVDGDADVEEIRRRFDSAVRGRAHRGSKIIVISRTEEHLSLGTVPPLRLRKPHPEERWYFFRALAFGAADPDDRPDLARVAMSLCTYLDCDLATYADACIIAASLRADLSVRSWRRFHKVFLEATMLQRGAAAGDGLNSDEDMVGHYNIFRPVKDAPATPCLFYNRRKLTGVARNDLPELTMLGLLTGDQSLPPAGETRFDVLMWQSRIPPYASYLATCDTDIARHQQVVAPKTRRLFNKRRDHQDDDPSK